MPTPPLVDAARAVRKDAVVFVHGFGSSPETCWGPLLTLFRNDPRITARFDLLCFPYPTRWANLHPLRRIPHIAEVAEALGTMLDSAQLAAYPQVTLVGHSQGGLVIQGYLANRVQTGRARDLARVRQAIFIATPSRGSTVLSGLRRLVSRWVDNPQERALRVLDPGIDAITRTVGAQIVDAGRRDDHCWPVPITCFWATEDRVVPEASARAPADQDNSFPIDGDHFSVVQPDGPDDRRYETIAGALLDPAGHRLVYEIELYEMTVRVEPLATGTRIQATHGGQVRSVAADNVAHVTRAVTFSRRNRCRNLFVLRYATKNEGYVAATASHPNEASPVEAARWEDHGTEAIFRFTPRGGERFVLQIDVYKGFDAGHRDVHVHLTTESYYRTIRLRLDLTAYLAAGCRVSRGPDLYLHPHDPQDHNVCRQRVVVDALPCASAGPDGCWEWSMSDVQDGVIDLVWDVTDPAGTGAGREIATP